VNPFDPDNREYGSVQSHIRASILNCRCHNSP
jgi:hypothetical protein